MIEMVGYLANFKTWIKVVLLWSIIIYSLICSMTVWASSDESVIPQDIAVSIARKKAEEVWGKITLGKPLLAYTLSGRPSVYIIPVRFGEEPFPEDDVILHEIRSAKIKMDEARRELADVRQSLLLGSSESNTKVYSSNQKISISISKKLIEAETKFKKASDQRWGIGKYGFVVISARKDMLPIQEFSNTLPLYYTRFDYARTQAKKALGKEVRLTKVFYAGPMDQMFEFSSNNKKVWVSPFRGMIYEPGSISESDRISKLSESAKRRIKQKWDEWLFKIRKEQ